MKDRNKSPSIHIPVRHRQAIDTSVPRISRYWKSKESGIVYEVQQYRRFVGVVNGIGVILRDAHFAGAWAPSFEVDIKTLKRDYEDEGMMRMKGK